MSRKNTTAQRLNDIPYEKRICRIEHYPTSLETPHTGISNQSGPTVEEEVNGIADAGTQIWSATAFTGRGIPLWPSKIMEPSPDANPALITRFLDKAHEKGISVEAELGMLGGVEEDININEKHAMLTDPNEAKEFVNMSGCDSLAVAIGTSHGAYKFAGGQGLHFERIGAIQERIPNFPLVMHGSSSVPKSEVDRINAAGGALDESARGVDEDEFARAIRLGVTKVNIDTDGRLVWTRVHREFFNDHPEVFDFRKPGVIMIEEYARFIEQKSTKLMSAGKLRDVRASVS